MFIGSLFDDTISKNVSYSYLQRGTDIAFNPNATKEGLDLPVYTKENGNLFARRPVSWSANSMLFNAIDLKVNVGEKAFIDHIYIKQGTNDSISPSTSHFLSIEVFTVTDGEYKKIGKFNPETGNKNCDKEEITIPIGYWCENLIVRFNGYLRKFHLDYIDIFAAWDMDDYVWPLPEKCEFLKDRIPFSSINSIAATTDDEIFVANYLNEKSDNAFEVKADGKIKIEIEGDGYEDGFIISVSKDKVLLKGKNRRSVLYAVDAFLQLIDGDSVKCVEIDHTSFKPMRGIHMGLPSKNQYDFLKNLVKTVIVPMQYNMIFLEIAGSMEYDKYPEINSTYLEGIADWRAGKRTRPTHAGITSYDVWTKAEVREFCEFMESYGIEVVPEVQCFAHVQYITSAHPEMAEIHAPDVEPDKDFPGFNIGDPGPGKFEYHAMCPNHPKYYEMMFNIIDEVIEAVQPKRFIHMGHDEVFPMGVCERCKNIPKAEIFTTEVNKMNAYVKSKGYQMMIWGDLIQKVFYSASNAVNTVDKDIIMLDFVWYYNMDKDIEDNLLKHGFKVMVGNLYSSTYPRFETRIKKPGMLGGEVSCWIDTCEEYWGFYGKIYDFIYTGTTLNNSGYDHNMRLTYNELIKPIIKKARIKLAKLGKTENETKVDIKGDINNIPYDIRGVVDYGGAVVANYNDREKTVAINGKGRLISFVHATKDFYKRIPWQDPYAVGEYEICYDDGTSYVKTLGYAKNIFTYRSTYAEPVLGVYSHQGYVGTYFTFPENGKTYDGDEYTLGKYIIKNPNPDKVIKEIKIKQNGESDANIIVFDIALID
ncbi:MAG: family 20 glycosylhydrolase [Clostridia bacterium]|nr:family 20 glycosylhydrolase [Clostridia bacterium]